MKKIKTSKGFDNKYTIKIFLDNNNQSISNHQKQEKHRIRLHVN